MIFIFRSEFLTSSKIFESMPSKSDSRSTTMDFRAELHEHDHDLGQLPGWMFEGLLLLVVQSDHAEFHNHSSSSPQPISKMLELRMKRACNIARFAGADLTADLDDDNVTHVVVGEDANTRAVRQKISGYGPLLAVNFCQWLTTTSSRKRLPRIVTIEWIERSWAEQTLLDEERKY